MAKLVSFQYNSNLKLVQSNYHMPLKSIGKKSVLILLEQLVKWRLKKIDPEIIGITGSVGKTSTKDAIYSVLADHIPTHCNKKSLNTEFGLMLAILEQESGYSSPLKWASAILKGAWSTFALEDAPYRELILEMGADKPGDIGYLLKHIKPKIGVFTAVKPAHLGEGQFLDLDSILEEKSKLVRTLPEDGWAILNADDQRVASLAGTLKSHVLTFGMSSKANLRAKHVESGRDGLRFTLAYEDKSHPILLPHLIGEHQIYVVLPAIAVGFLMGMPLPKIVEGLKNYHLPPGRMNRLEGVEDSMIIDSSYNASPDTMTAALDVLRSLPGRKIAALGSMNELGELTEQEHRRIGKMVPQTADMLITVGEAARYYAEEALSHGLSKDFVYQFDSAKAAGEFLKNKIRKDDIILAKGSQNKIRMEHLVHELMKDPSRANELLVRQDDYWKTH
jgi:UDP-N-acetylmuramoyl-tripeptide--D-alanyl-D-alanine ligase